MSETDRKVRPAVSLGFLVTLAVTLAVMAVVVLLWAVKARIEGNESAAASSLKTFHGQFCMWKKKNYTGNGRVYPVAVSRNPAYVNPGNLGKYCGLHFEINSAAERIKMIGIAEARADCRADGKTKGNVGAIGEYIPSVTAKAMFTMAPKAGYWFGLCNRWGDATTQVYDWTRAGNHFGIVAFPAEYGSTGEDTLFINEEGTIYFLDRGKGEWTNYPGNDPVAQSIGIRSE